MENIIILASTQKEKTKVYAHLAQVHRLPV